METEDPSKPVKRQYHRSQVTAIKYGHFQDKLRFLLWFDTNTCKDVQ